jgi:hypothetical protein
MKVGLFTEFSYPEKSGQQAYADILEQIVRLIKEFIGW